MVNLSGDSAQDYFADGMTEVLSTDLARLGGFKRVTARGSVIRYKGTSKPLEEIARELKVDALVTGSVLRSGDRVSITAQLLDPATGDQLWTNRYERSLQDVLVLRSEIVSAIVREIRMKLSPAEEARLASAGPVNTEAFEAYLKGRFHWLKQTPADYDLAERYFQLALDKDPGYALAYAGLGSVWMMRGDAGFQPPSETFPKATTFIARAFELDDSLADLHLTLANHIVTVEWDWAGAERELQAGHRAESESRRRPFLLQRSVADAQAAGGMESRNTARARTGSLERFQLELLRLALELRRPVRRSDRDLQEASAHWTQQSHQPPGTLGGVLPEGHVRPGPRFSERLFRVCRGRRVRRRIGSRRRPGCIPRRNETRGRSDGGAFQAATRPGHPHCPDVRPRWRHGLGVSMAGAGL